MSAQRYEILPCEDGHGGTLWYVFRVGANHPAHWGGHLTEEFAREWVKQRGGELVA